MAGCAQRCCHRMPFMPDVTCRAHRVAVRACVIWEFEMIDVKMIDVTYVLNDGQARTLSGEEGLSVMELAVRHGLPSLDGDCGGCMSCGTCHAYVDPAFQAQLEAPSEGEQAMLEHVANPRPESRLTCQIRLTAGLQGLRVTVPEPQAF